jgi:hypothetical protein
MAPPDIRTISKLEAAIQQVEAAIELFYAKRYVPAITLAAAAEGCLARRAPSTDVTADDPPGPPDPLFEMLKRSAPNRWRRTEQEAIKIINALVYWLKHPTQQAPATVDVTDFDAWFMICRAITKIEHSEPGSETPAITEFIEFSRQHYSKEVGVKSSTS